ncbi:MAG: S8 family serine peptidase [Candidatus Eisenbacteria bacterium]
MSASTFRRTISMALGVLLLTPIPSFSFIDDDPDIHRVILEEPLEGVPVDPEGAFLRWAPLPGAERYVLLFSPEPFAPVPGEREPSAPLRRETARNGIPLASIGLPPSEANEWYWAVAALRGRRWETSEARRLRIGSARGAASVPIRKIGRGRFDPRGRAGEMVLSNGVSLTAGRAESGHDSLSRYGIVRFRGPVREEWRRAIEARGAVVAGYLPDDALVVRWDRAVPTEIASSPGVSWTAPYRPEYKRSPALAGPAKRGEIDAVVLLFPGEDSGPFARNLEESGIEVTARGREIVRARLGDDDLETLLRDERVRWIEPRTEARLFNDQCQWVVQSDVAGLRSLWQEGLRGEGIILSLCDSGIRTTHQMYRDDARAVSTWGDYPDHRKLIAYRRSVDSPFVLFGDDPGAWYHGTHTACTLAGNDSTLGGSAVDGVAPDAKIFFVDGGGASNIIYTPVDLGELFLPVYEGNEAGAPRIMSNSWGALLGGAYDSMCEQTDRFVWEHKDFLLLFSNGNGGIPNSVASPAASKNCLAVGGTENGSSADQIYSGSSRGPADDGRRKPAIVAPARLQSASGEWDGAYQTLDGTSMAAPSAAAGAGLMMQYFVEGRYPSGVKEGSPAMQPSAALLRAALVAGAEGDMNGYETPSNDVGWGRIRLSNVLYFPGNARRLAVVDETAGLLTGETAEYEITVASGAEPLEIVLVWTDYPASPAASRNLVNDLDLVVSGGGQEYLGNVFSGGSSLPGGARDSIDVEEVVLVPDPAPGTWSIEVRAEAVPFGPQPFAIVVTGDLDGSAASVAFDRSSYGGDDMVTVRVEDGDLEAGPVVAFWSDTEGEPESIILAGGGGVFAGTIATSTGLPIAGDGLLAVSHGDSIRVAYDDASGGGPRVAAASVSLAGPMILPPSGASPSGGDGEVSWETDVPADSRILFGLDPAFLPDTVRAPELVLSHRIPLAGLLPDTTYYYRVESSDFRGNRTVDDGGGEPYRLTTGPRDDVLVVIGDMTFEKAGAYRDALDRHGWTARIVEGTLPALGDRTRGLRSHPAVWWQAGWEEYPPFSDAARETIDRYLEGGGRLGVVSHDAAWALGDPTSPYRTAETETWLAERLKVAWNAEPSYWSIVFGYGGDYISGDYTFGVSYDPFRSGGAGDEIEAADEGAGATIDSVWKNNYGNPVGLRWRETAASGDPGSAVWGGTANRGVTYCFEWSELNEWIEDDYHRGRILDRSLRWMIGRDHPDVTLTSLGGGGTVTSAPATIAWNETAPGGVGSRRIEWSGDGGASWTAIDEDAGSGPYSWDLEGVPNGTAVRVRVTLFDAGDPPLTGRSESESDFTVALPGNDPRGPRVIAGSASIAPDPARREGEVVLTAILSDSTRGGSDVIAAEWSLGPEAPGEGVPMSGAFGFLTATAVDTLSGALLAIPVDTIWVRGMDEGGAWGEAYPLPVTVRGDFTGVGEAGPPAKFALHGNAPNPFNPSTVIRFDLARESKTRLAVYTPAGRHVRGLVNGNLSAGPHQVVWNGRNEGGQEVGSGVYLVRLEAGEDRAVRKIVLLR